MPLWLYARWRARFPGWSGGLGRSRGRGWDRGQGWDWGLGRQAGFSTAEGLAGAALAVVALIAIWAAMKAFGLDIIRWMQDQITSAGGGAGGP